MSNSDSINLPDYLKKCLDVSTSVKITFSVIDSAPDILICSKEGYLYEIKNKKITNSLNLRNVGTRIIYVHFVENKKPLLFYLVQTSENHLLIIKRLNELLEVVKICHEVFSFEVDDFQSRGYPQISIKKSTKNSIIDFPVHNAEAVIDESDCETNSVSIGKSLAEKLQIVSRHVDELTEEWYSVTELCKFNTDRKDFSVFHIDGCNFSMPLEDYVGKMTLITTWIKVIGETLVLGMKIRNDGQKAVSSLEFKLLGETINDYSYRFFSTSKDHKDFYKGNPFLSCEKINLSILPGQEITVAASVTSFVFTSGTQLQISCYLISSVLKNCLLSKTFEISISKMIDYSKEFFPSLEKSVSVEHVQAIKTAKSETKLKIEAKNITNNCFKNILVTKLEFVEVKIEDFELYYCISNCLKEVFIAFQTLMSNENCFEINLYTSWESQIYFFLGLMYEFLPECTFLLIED